MSYEGYMTANEYKCLRDYAHNSQVGIMDIGTFNGASAKEMRIAASEDVPVWTIDMFPIAGGNERSPMNIVYENFLGLNPIFVIIGDSHLVGRFWKTPIDLLVIDGSHTFEAVSEDFGLFSKSLVSHGVVILHDAMNREVVYKAMNGGVVQANQGVWEFLETILLDNWEVIDSIDTLAVLKRRIVEDIDVSE